ncbi:hypothetical protein DFQ27_003318 [Actinomortierella ambigua]|uniref:C2H2-type domain-containing protein n=1 Tax=Actinomortierella ambigua TaxID=1343610 RepID=A0A9P6U4Z8_9FUNG|nr:hypothetical protein DFQ27_003318 [Actinomortierella ambigua]
MSDDNEWTTVTRGTGHKARPTSAVAQKGGSGKYGQQNAERRKSRGPLQPQAAYQDKEKKGASGSQAKNRSRSTGSGGAGGESSGGESDGGDSEDSEDDNEDELAKYPPYHTTIIIQCPFHGCKTTDPFTDSTSLVSHLKNEHQLAFKNIHHMFILLERYINHWASEIEAKGLDKVAVLAKDDDKSAEDKENKTVYYIIDPATSSHDRALRDQLQREKLNEILQIQERERNEEAKLKRKCLFCKNVCENRTILFKHMFVEHNFNIGLPDNLVNVNEFLDMLEAKLTNLQCLYCEKTFTSPAVLRKHMRKKKHFKISARNRLYDQFYVINYLEPGMNWENFENDRYESDEDGRRDDSWADWDDALEEETTKCLFENEYFNTVELTKQHMQKSHGFDLDALRHRMELDFYQTITLINYIRRQTMMHVCFSCQKPQEGGDEGLVKHLTESGCGTGKTLPGPAEGDFWRDAQFLLPILENDPLLMIFRDEDVEDDGDDEEDDDDDTEGAAGRARVRLSRTADQFTTSDDDSD